METMRQRMAHKWIFNETFFLTSRLIASHPLCLPNILLFVNLKASFTDFSFCHRHFIWACCFTIYAINYHLVRNSPFLSSSIIKIITVSLVPHS